MNDWKERTELLLGSRAVESLLDARVLLFGLGGVGGAVAEALIRSGVGGITAVDDGIIKESNINRQILADSGNVGMPKTDVFKNRALLINPQLQITVLKEFVREDNAEEIITGFISGGGKMYAADAIDTVTGKTAIIKACKKFGLPVISCMGTGNKLDPSAFKVADIYSTKVCPLCRVMRSVLKKEGIDSLDVVYSEEIPSSAVVSENGRNAPASVSFVPPAAGLVCASRIIMNLIDGGAYGA